MGRQRLYRTTELEKRTIFCKCGEPVTVFDKNVQSVICCYCATNTLPIKTDAQFSVYMDIIEQKEKENIENPVEKKKRGRPRKVKIEEGDNNGVKNSDLTSSIKNPQKRGRGRPRKNKDKENIMVKTGNKKTEPKKVKGKRGRKATVGAAVLKFINESDGNVSFKDILNVYSTKRTEMGKRQDDKIEERNCRSTLYILKDKCKIREVEKNTVYAKI